MISAEQLHLDTRRHVLDNGLRVVLHRDPALPLVAINLWYHVGSKNESPGRTGFAHLFEHLLFQGSQHVGTNEHFHLVQEAGGVANGSTWYDRTAYHETLPAHQMDLGLWLESDRMGFFLPAITEEKLATQRAVVINERRQRVDNQPYGRAIERIHELLYPEGHPYRWPVIGYIEDLTAATLDDVRAFFHSYYTPGNTVLTLAGDIDYDQALERVAIYFGDIAARPLPPPVVLPSVGLSEARRDVLLDQVQLPRIYLAFHLPAYGHPAWYAADLLATALSSGKSSILYRDLVYRRQLAQDVSCYVYPTEATSLFLAILTAKPGVDIDQLETAFIEHLDRASFELLEEEDLERSHNSLLTSHFSYLQHLDNRADLLSRFTTYFDDPSRLVEEALSYSRTTPEMIREVAARYAAPHQRAVVTVVPEDGASTVESES